MMTMTVRLVVLFTIAVTTTTLYQSAEESHTWDMHVSMYSVIEPGEWVEDSLQRIGEGRYSEIAPLQQNTYLRVQRDDYCTSNLVASVSVGWTSRTYTVESSRIYVGGDSHVYVRPSIPIGR